MKRLFFLLLLAPLVAAQTINISIDANANRKRIDERIYGLNFATEAQLKDLNVPLNRSGGNANTRYNWQQNASNQAFDWFYESLEHGPNVPGQEADAFIQEAKNAHAEPMITLPIMGWVAKLGPNRQRLSSYSIAKYGAQQKNDWEWFPDAGNGVRTDGTRITNNDEHDANMPVDAEFQRGWIQHLLTTWGGANMGGVRYYILDNEHSIWQSTHRDVKKIGATMDEVLDRMIAHSEVIKSVDPRAVVVGPEEWGWTGYLLSGYDQQWAAANNNWWNTPDKVAHGGMDYLPWLLKELKAHDVASGHKTIDVFSVHFYPQGGEYSDDVSQSMQLRRNRSTRALWDPNYTDETWIGTQVRLFPRLREWIAAHYP
ncbi:MAG: glycoside hydrolase family 44 protein, partial [Thermoanaerobaculia bacterium]